MDSSGEGGLFEFGETLIKTITPFNFGQEEDSISSRLTCCYLLYLIDEHKLFMYHLS